MSALIAEAGVPITGACRALSLPRSSHYRTTPEAEADVQLRDQIQQVALAWLLRRVLRRLA